MKIALASALLAAAAQIAVAHYTFPDLIVNGTTTTDWQYVRITENHYSQAPVTDVTSPEFRCYELDMQASAGQTGTATVTAGSTIGFKADNVMGHPGYFSVYLSPASPAANSPQAGTGNTWFKIWEWAPTWGASTGLVFASEIIFTLLDIQQFTFTIPKSLPSGQYLVRGEQIALHVASTYQGAQFYIGCGQLNVVGGGSGKPSPTVSIPGVYNGREPGILINIYALPSNFTGYPAPGPAVWKG